MKIYVLYNQYNIIENIIKDKIFNLFKLIKIIFNKIYLIIII